MTCKQALTIMAAIISFDVGTALAQTLEDRASGLSSGLYQSGIMETGPSPTMREIFEREAVDLLTDAADAGREDILHSVYGSAIRFYSLYSSFNKPPVQANPAIIERALADSHRESAGLRQVIVRLLRMRIGANDFGKAIEQRFVALIDDPSPDVCAEALRAVNQLRIRVQPGRLARYLADPDDRMLAFNASALRAGLGPEPIIEGGIGGLEAFIREEAMVARLRAGSLEDDIAVYPTLDDTGRLVALLALLRYDDEGRPGGLRERLREREVSMAVVKFIAMEAKWIDGRDAAVKWRRESLGIAVGMLGGIALGSKSGLVHADGGLEAQALIESMAREEGEADRAVPWSEDARLFAREMLEMANNFVEEGR